MKAASLRALRRQAGLKQSEMAQRMGLGYRSYQELEGGRAPLTQRHIAVMERISLSLAVELGDAAIALPTITQEAAAFTALIDQTGSRRLSNSGPFSFVDDADDRIAWPKP